MAGAEVLQPPVLRREQSAGGIPVYTGRDVLVKQRPPSGAVKASSSGTTAWFGPTEFEIQGMTWTIDKFLSFGAEGQAYLTTHKSSGERFVAKFCRSRDSKEVKLVQDMPRELVVHENFVKYEMIVLDVSAHFAPAQDILFMEHIPNGELFDLLASQEPSIAGKPVSVGTSRRFVRDVIRGMAECYRFGVTHRDLKPENLLINECGRIVIIDMGHAKRQEPPKNVEGTTALDRTTTTNAYGTPAFSAPEVEEARRAKKQYDCEAADVWSLGVIAFYLHAKLPCFKQAGGVCSFEDVAGADNAPLWALIAKYSAWYPAFPDDLKLFINTLWRKIPAERPSFAQLEKAIGGDSGVIERFPGLQWLAEPVNDAKSFVDELRRSRPDLEFREVDGSSTAEAAEALAEAPAAEYAETTSAKRW